MPLGSFDEVYQRYHALVKRDFQQIYGHGRYEEFAWQPYRLLEAYALATQALENKSVVLHTSFWERQTGATTAAIALMMASKDVFVMKADMRAAKATSTRIFRTFPEASEFRNHQAQPAYIHENVLWMTSIHHQIRGEQPTLIVVDSETAYRKDRDQAIDILRTRDCGVLVLDGPPGWVF